MKQLELRSAYFERYCRNWLSFTELNDSGSKLDGDSCSKLDLSSDVITVTISVNLSTDLILMTILHDSVAWIYFAWGVNWCCMDLWSIGRGVNLSWVYVHSVICETSLM